MNLITIDKKEFMEMLFAYKPFSFGQFGILTAKDNKIYKIYYKDYADAFITRNPDKIDELIDFYHYSKSIINSNLRNPIDALFKFKELEKTKSNNLITGVLSYKGIFVGVEMKYFENYITLKEATKSINIKDLNIYLNKASVLISDLISHNILPSDIKEDNILVNLETKDLVLIDLDGIDTTYGSENPYTKRRIVKSLNEMKKRLEELYIKDEATKPKKLLRKKK